MHILTLAHDLESLGGLERCQLAVGTALQRLGHEVSLAYLRDGDLHPEWEAITFDETKVDSMRLVPQRPVRSGTRLLKAVRSLRHQRFDVVYASHYRQLQIGAATARLARIPLVFHVHNRPPVSLGPVGRRQVRLPDRSVVVSQSNAEAWWRVGLDRPSTRVVLNGVDTDRFAPAPSADEIGRLRRRVEVSPSAFVVSFIGGTANDKGAGVLLDAWHSLGLRPGDGELLILGRPDAELRRQLESLSGASAGATVRVVGHQPDVVPWLRLSDVVAVPSNTHDPCPLAVLEGLACGRPVVGSRIGGIPEMLTGRLADLLVEPGDAVALAAGLDALRGWSVDRPELGVACRQHVLDRFTLDRMVDDLEEVFGEVVGPTTREPVPSIT
jgi:glycosyltransferase involved in cell wall biosynthesis